MDLHVDKKHSQVFNFFPAVLLLPERTGGAVQLCTACTARELKGLQKHVFRLKTERKFEYKIKGITFHVSEQDLLERNLLALISNCPKPCDLYDRSAYYPAGVYWLTLLMATLNFHSFRVGTCMFLKFTKNTYWQRYPSFLTRGKAQLSKIWIKTLCKKVLLYITVLWRAFLPWAPVNF